MRFTTVLPIIGSLATLGNAVAIPQADPYVGDLRTFSGTDCFEGNQGVYTFTKSLTSKCNAFAEAVNSIYVHIEDGWSLVAYEAQDCSSEGWTIQGTEPSSEVPTVCNYAQSSPWLAYKVSPTSEVGNSTMKSFSRLIANE
ncbi:hypothetical protein F4780DRAFT_715079 [Xylariomycetidae sp. FL0641]|nr:hypothetical protein F4780DRAFT_715079 [Xylariomycetidae sp. FL0641]